MYYDNKIEILRDIFGADVVLDRDVVQVGAAAYPIIDDVIVVLPPDRYPASVAARITGQQAHAADCATAPFSPAIQQSLALNGKVTRPFCRNTKPSSGSILT